MRATCIVQALNAGPGGITSETFLTALLEYFNAGDYSIKVIL